MTWLLVFTNLLTLFGLWFAYSKGKRAGERAALSAMVDKHETDQKIREDVKRMSDADIVDRLRQFERP